MKCVLQEHKFQVSVAETFIFENILQKSVKFGNSSYEGKVEGRTEGRVRQGRSLKRLLEGFKENIETGNLKRKN
jgi:hypothetical protein